jgi:protein SCO1/2
MTPDDRKAAPAAAWTSTSPRERIRQRYFPDVTLLNQDGRSVRLYEDLIRDKIVVINFFYATCQGICTPLTSNLTKVQTILKDRVGRDIFMYSFTLKPDLDTPDVLREYAGRFHVGPGWQFLTGKPADLDLVRRRLGFTDPDPVRDADKTNHTGMIRYGNEPLTLWAACPGLSRPDSVVKSILAVDIVGRTSAKGHRTT